MVRVTHKSADGAPKVEDRALAMDMAGAIPAEAGGVGASPGAPWNNLAEKEQGLARDGSLEEDSKAVAGKAMGVAAARARIPQEGIGEEGRLSAAQAVATIVP